VQGAADSRFSNVVRVFAGLFPGRRFGGGALSVYIDGRPVVDAWTGWSDRAGEQPWSVDTGAMVFSATKGVAATVVHRLVDRGVLSYDEPVAAYWPEFGANGKDTITVRDVLRHRSGLSHLKGVTKEELLDHELMEARLAAAAVDRLRGWPAYHALTYGWILSGLTRAVTGQGMRELIRQEVARPLDTDGLHLGRPPAGSPTKVAQILAPQKSRANPVFNFVAPKVAGLPCPALSARCSSPASNRLCKAISHFWTARFRRQTVLSRPEVWPRCMPPSPTAAASMTPASCPRSWHGD
jgi:CubicO group peptidase (beta-lactamase class C family)